MSLTSHLIIYNTSDADILTEIDEARNECCHRIGCRLRIDHQHHRDIQYSRYLVGRALFTVVAIEETHHSLDNADVSILAIMVEELTNMLWSRHKGIKVDTGSATDSRMELRVDIVWTTLEGLHLQTFGCEECHQSPDNRRLARATGWGCDKKGRFRSHLRILWCKIKKNPRIMHYLFKKNCIFALRNGNLVADAATM